MDLSDNVTFDKAMYPGISTQNLAGLIQTPEFLCEDMSEDEKQSLPSSYSVSHKGYVVRYEVLVVFVLDCAFLYH